MYSVSIGMETDIQFTQQLDQGATHSTLQDLAKLNLNSTCALACRKSIGHSFYRKRKEPTYIIFQRLIQGMQSSKFIYG